MNGIPQNEDRPSGGAINQEAEALDDAELPSLAKYADLKSDLARRNKEILQLKSDFERILQLLHSSQEELEKYLNICGRQSELLMSAETLQNETIKIMASCTKNLN